MSDFSEYLKDEIKKSNKSLRYLAEASGLTLDHISKMRLGKRLPQDEKKVRSLIDALQCPKRTARKLFHLYKQEQLGKAQWDCFQEISSLLTKSFSDYHFLSESCVSSVSFTSADTSGHAVFGAPEALTSKEHISAFMEHLIRTSCQKQKKIRILSKAVDELLLYELISTLCCSICSTPPPQHTKICFFIPSASGQFRIDRAYFPVYAKCGTRAYTV